MALAFFVNIPFLFNNLIHFISERFFPKTREFRSLVARRRVSRKLRPRKLRPQTRKTQTLGCLENSDLEKTQTPGCLENSDPKNSDPWMSRKRRPEKLRPSGCLENSDPKNKTYLHRVNAASRLAYCSLIQWHYHNLPRKEKQFIVS